MWRVGAKLVHPFNPELGIGVVREVDGRFLEVEFIEAERTLRLSAEASGLEPLVLPAGARAVLIESGEEVRIALARDHLYELADGRTVDDAELWPLETGDEPLEKLVRGRIDPLFSFRNRIEGMQLAELRESGGLGSFLGGRIELFPHQLHTALAAVERDPVRWLLADEVGLGKTIEACLVLSALVRTGRAQRALVVAPGTLVVQWLGELYRKFHQIFVWLDEARLESAVLDYGEDANPFDVHPFGVIALELLGSEPELLRQAREVGLDLVVIDEAHHLDGQPHSGELRELVAEARHALLLTATPLKADREGFFRLLSLLHPDTFPSFADFQERLASGAARMPCTSAVRRQDLGGLPPRVPRCIELPALPPAGAELRKDPRAAWIAERVRDWLARREKVLVFVHGVEELERLARFLERATTTHVSMFHEEITQARRDIEVARFRDSNAPVLLCSEAGGEGRNFQFCDRMIHYDLPLDPVALEQRIGRLDRIGRTKPVEIVYFRPAESFPDVAGLYDRLDLFGVPSAGLDAALAGVQQALEAAVAGAPLDAEELALRVDEARRRGVRDLPRSFYPDAYDGSQRGAILARVPDDLEARTRAFCRGAARDLGLTLVEKGGVSMQFVELGATLLVEGLPGVPDGARYLGTFDRVEALQHDELDFFASGHPLVEGLLLELEDGARGRATVFRCQAEGVEGTGLLCVFRMDSGVRYVVVDTRGKLRPEWQAPLLAALPSAAQADPDDLALPTDLATTVRALGAIAEESVGEAPLSAVALFTTLG